MTAAHGTLYPHLYTNERSRVRGESGSKAQATFFATLGTIHGTLGAHRYLYTRYIYINMRTTVPRAWQTQEHSLRLVLFSPSFRRLHSRLGRKTET